MSRGTQNVSERLNNTPLLGLLTIFFGPLFFSSQQLNSHV